MHTKSLKHWDANGGALGLDSPTFLASVGWNWLPTIPGREIGIWNKVWLSATDDVSLVDPFVSVDLPLPDTSRADLTVRVEVWNHSSKAVRSAGAKCWLQIFISEEPVGLDGGATKQIVHKLSMDHPRLWWPNGMGEQNLYSMDLKFDISERTSDSQSYLISGCERWGMRFLGGVLLLYVNGHRMLIRGRELGNA